MMRSESTSALAQPRLTNPTLGGLVRDRARLRRGEAAVVGMGGYITITAPALQARSFAASGRARCLAVRDSPTLRCYNCWPDEPNVGSGSMDEVEPPPLAADEERTALARVLGRHADRCLAIYDRRRASGRRWVAGWSWPALVLG